MKKLCISIGPDWPLAEQEFKRVGLEVEKFQAIVEDNRVLAFNRSVYQAMLSSLSFETEKIDVGTYKFKPVPNDLLLFEDDIEFDNLTYQRKNDYQSGNFIIDGLDELPKDYLTLHLGCNIIGTDTTVWQMPTYHSQHLAKLHNCWQSHATLYSAECVKYIIDNFKYVTDEYKTEGCMIFDEWLRVNVLNQGRSYLMNPMIAYQRPRHSEIWNRASDYTGAHNYRLVQKCTLYYNYLVSINEVSRHHN